MKDFGEIIVEAGDLNINQVTRLLGAMYNLAYREPIMPSAEGMRMYAQGALQRMKEEVHENTL